MCKEDYKKHDVFGVQMPTQCPGVPSEVLDPVRTWARKEDYYEKAKTLARAFHKNFEKYKGPHTEEILSGAPLV